MALKLIVHFVTTETEIYYFKFNELKKKYDSEFDVACEALLIAFCNFCGQNFTRVRLLRWVAEIKKVAYTIAKENSIEEN